MHGTSCQRRPQAVRFGEDAKDQGVLIGNTHPQVNALEVALHGGGLDSEPAGDFFLLLVTKNQLDDLPFALAQPKPGDDVRPQLCRQGQGGKSPLIEGLDVPFHGGPAKKERRTRAAPGAPAKGHGKRTLADAPCGARLKALLSQMKLGGFPGSSDLTLARHLVVANAMT